MKSGDSYRKEAPMTKKEKKKEKEVFQQETSKEELTAVTGGDCGKSSFVHGPCPKGASIVELCRENANQFLPEDMPKPANPANPGEVPFKELTDEELQELIKGIK